MTPTRQLALAVEERRVLPLELRARGELFCAVNRCPEPPVAVMADKARERLCKEHRDIYVKRFGWRVETALS